MYCSKCGNKLEEGAVVCGKCGAAVKKKTEKEEKVPQTIQQGQPAKNGSEPEIQPEPENQTDLPEDLPEKEDLPSEPEEQSRKSGKSLLTGILIAVIILVLAGTAAVVYLNRDVFFFPASAENAEESERTEKEEQKTGEEKEDAGETTAEETEAQPVRAENALAAKIVSLNASGDSTTSIDVFADNYTPGTRNTSYAWDRSLFYTLEDVDPNSAADGRINGYSIVRKMLKNSETGNKMEYEIYTNPSIGKVNKIVSIEYVAGHLEITDYYYDDKGKISFIFVRDDVNYVPSYAVPTKDGERFYFNSDCLVKWRVVENGAQTNFVIGSEAAKNNPAGSVVQYSGMDNPSQTNYDNAEKQRINAAYNTYNTVLGAEGVSEITGYVYDQNGLARADASVELFADGDRLYETKTDSAGLYGIIVPSENRTYRLDVSSDGCAASSLYGIDVSSYVLSDYQDTIYMVGESDSTYDIFIQLYDALNYAADGRSLERLSNAAVYVRDGMNHRDGDVVAQGTADGSGELRMSLKPGMYTAEVVKQGYDKIYCNFAVKQNMETIQISSSPTLAAGEVRIVLTWGEQPYDLDSHLFTPYDSSLGDSTYHIWYGNRNDAVGDNLDVDDTDSYGPETMTIPTLKDGLYKYYVADYTHCSQGEPSSYEMSYSGATVNVYTATGLTATFHVPANSPGAIWEVFEIRNGAIVPIQRYYSNIDDKSWWHNDN